MTYYLYLDVIFLINWSMDFLILMLLKRGLKLHSKISTMLAAAAVGAAWACLVIVFPVLPRMAEALTTYIMISALMIKLAFPVKTIPELLRGVVAFYLAAVMLGGIMTGFYQYTRTGEYIERLMNGGSTASLPILIFLFLAAGSAFLCIYIWRITAAWYRHKKNIFQITLYYRDQRIKTTGLVDTGNRLYHPVTHRPVSIMTAAVGRQLCDTVTAVSYIPFQAVGTESGMLPAIFLDRMEIEQNGKITTVKKPLMAIYQQPLSPGEEYQILLHEEMMQS